MFDEDYYINEQYGIKQNAKAGCLIIMIGFVVSLTAIGLTIYFTTQS